MKSISLLLFLALIVSGCKKGERNEEVKPEPIHVLSLSVVDYNEENVFIKVKGTIEVSTIVNLDTLEFFENPSCSGEVVGSSIVKDFESKGVILELTSNQSKKLYLATQNSSDCLFFMTYDKEDLSPSSPKFEKTSPESPTRETANPGIFGSAFPPSSEIKFYSNNSCTVLVGEGSIEDYSGNGIALNLTENTTTTIYGQVVDLKNKKSPCTYLADFEHIDSVLTSPVFTGSVPISPNNTSFSPFIKGNLPSEAISVTIYSDSACSNNLATGTPEDFSSPGIQIILSENSTTNLYAKSIDDLGNPSGCTLLTTYVHDAQPPIEPIYGTISPTSPNNSNLFPKISGTATSDTLTVKLFDSLLCLVQIGSGTKTQFQSSGLSASVDENSTTMIYGQDVDASGNVSSCTYLTSYKHNTIPPNFPTFLETIPDSPNNNNIQPFIKGTLSQFTNGISFYDDDSCTHLVGTGAPADYESTGIQLSLQANTNNSIYVQVSDLEGNISSCGFHASYAHSNLPAPNPTFSYSFPASPTNGSNMPFFIGSADSTIVNIVLYDSNTCMNPLGSGSRGQYLSSGIQVTVPSNSTNQIYAISEDIYGNYSSCGFLTTFIHNTINPDAPVYSTTNPTSPNSTSTTPFVMGSSSTPVSSQLPPFKVSFYDSSACSNKIGEGSPAAFASTGITVNTSSDSITSIYAKTFDEANNSSACTLMTNYTHDSLKPSIPILLSTTPTTPSFSEDIKLKGIFGASPDFLNRVSVGIYTNSICTNLLTSGSPTDYTGAGLPVTVSSNSTTSLYAATVNEVGTSSNCQFQINFTHNNTPPQSFNVVNNLDGSTYSTWQPDLTSSPQPTYTIERSLSATGPFTVIGSSISGNNYTDDLVTNNMTYYYRVFSTNSTGRSLYSNTGNVNVSVGNPVSDNNLAAFPGAQSVRLVWGANIANMTYKVYRSTQYGGPFTPLPVELSATQYTDTTVINNTTYYYMVTGLNPSGESMQSNIASAYPRPVPPAPQNLVINTVPEHPDCANAPGVQLSWTPTGYYDSFGIMRAAGGGSRNLQTTTNNTTYTYCGLNNDTNYSFSITAQWGTSSSAESNVVYYREIGGPGLSISAGENEILLSWNQPDGGNLYNSDPALYDIFRATKRDGPYTKIVDGTGALTHSDNTVVQGVAYFYYVQTHVTISGPRKYHVGPHTPIRSSVAGSLPNDPTNLTLVDNTSVGTVELHWTPPTHFNGFNLYTSNSLGGPYNWASNVTTPKILSAPVSDGMNYFYIKAGWGDQETGATNIVSYRKSTISGFDTLASPTTITLSWNAVPGIQDYRIWRSTTYNGNYSEIANPTTNNYVDNTAVAGTGYYYKVSSRFPDATEGQLSIIKQSKLTGTNAPNGVSVSVQTPTTVKVYWVPVAGAISYSIYSATAIGGPYTLKATLASGSETTISGLTQNAEYFFKVIARVGLIDYESSIVSTFLYDTPSGLTGTVGNNQINMSWNPVIGALNYDLLRSNDGSNFSTIASNQPTTSYLDSTAVNGQLYFYKVRANFISGNTLSLSSTGMTPGIVPLPPVSLQVDNLGTGTDIFLNWEEVSGVTKYNVYVDSISGVHVTPIFSSGSNRDVLVAGLSLGNTYYIVVKSVNGTVESSESPEVSVVLSLNTSAPSVLDNGLGAVDLSWSAVPGASTYSIYRSENELDFMQLASGIATSSYTDSAISANKNYYYKYESYTAGGDKMAKSDISSSIAIDIVPNSPTGFYISAVDQNSVDLNWITVSNISHYNIHRSTTQGGPYTVIDTVAAPGITYNDSTVTPGNTYYYVVQSENAQGVKSILSNELSINLLASPQNLIASNSLSAISLNWDDLAGATQYKIKRSLLATGPFGEVGTSASSDYQDISVEPSETYYYVVEGVYAGNILSPQSNIVSITKSGAMNLQVPVEMLDTRIASSSSGDVVFLRSQTTLNTLDYDGTVSFELEVLANNTDSSSRAVQVVDEGGIVVKTIMIPANTLEVTRFREGFTPNVGDEVYKIKLEASSVNGNLQVHSTRILINQTNATKTKLYFPLLSLSQTSSHLDSEVSAITTNNSTYQTVESSIPFNREIASLSHIQDVNAWELETVVSTTDIAVGNLVLYNKTTSAAVITSETRFDSNQVTLAKVQIDEGVIGFQSSNENNKYDVRLKCEYDCSVGSVRLHKAGLWVKLDQLSKVVIFYRNGSLQSYSGASHYTQDDRVLIDPTQYSNPLLYFEAGLSDDPSSSADVSLQYHNDESGTVGLSSVVSSNISMNSDGTLYYRNPTPLTLSPNEKFLTLINPSGGLVKLIYSGIVVKSSSN